MYARAALVASLFAACSSDPPVTAPPDGPGGDDAAITYGGEIGPTAAECAPAAIPTSPLCEATNGAHCYYLDPAAGNDTSGDGTFANPWRSFANVVTYYGTPGYMGSTPRPATSIDLAPGDYVYLRSGTFADSYNYAGSTVAMFFRTIDAGAAPIHIKGYPGQSPVIAPTAQAVAIHILQSKGFVVEDLEIAMAYQWAVWIEESDGVVLRRLHVHDTDGVDNDNTSGVHFLSTTHAELSCSIIHDNYDHTNADTGGVATTNSTNVVAFSGGDLRIHHDLFYQTPAPRADKSGGCVKYKHAETVADGVFEVDHNLFHSCKFFAVGTGTQHSHVHHNIIVDGGGIESDDFGGPTHQSDQIFAFNTFHHADVFGFTPTTDWNTATFDDPKAIRFSDNIIVEARTAATQESGTIRVGTYSNDTLFTKTTPELTFDRNCYKNESGALHFDYFAANGGSYGVLGEQYDFAGWQARGFDASSAETDPGFADAANGDFTVAPMSPCAKMGAYAQP